MISSNSASINFNINIVDMSTMHRSPIRDPTIAKEKITPNPHSIEFILLPESIVVNTPFN